MEYGTTYERTTKPIHKWEVTTWDNYLLIICLLTKGCPCRKVCCVFCCVCRCVLRAVELPWNIPGAQMRISVVEEEMGKQKAAREEHERRAEVWDARYVIPASIFLIFCSTIFCMRNIHLAGVITSHNGNKMRRRMPEILDLKSGSSCSGATLNNRCCCLQQWNMMQGPVKEVRTKLWGGAGLRAPEYNFNPQ